MYRRKMIHWGGCLYSWFVQFYKATEVGSKPSPSPFTSVYRLCRRRYLDMKVQPLPGLALAQHGLPCIRHIAPHGKTKADEVRSGSHESFKKKSQGQSPLWAERQRHPPQRCRGGRHGRLRHHPSSELGTRTLEHSPWNLCPHPPQMLRTPRCSCAHAPAALTVASEKVKW